MLLLCASIVIVLIMAVILIHIIFLLMVLLDSNMIETMNEQQLKLTNFMREHDLSHETGLTFCAPELNVNLFDDGESFPNLRIRGSI